MRAGNGNFDWSEDSHEKNGSIVKTSKLEGEDPENESRCPLRNIIPDVKESESKMKLVGSDANENIAWNWSFWCKNKIVVTNVFKCGEGIE